MAATKSKGRASSRTSSSAKGSTSRGSSARRGGGGGGRKRASGAGAKTTTDHDEIRQGAEQRGAKPRCVRGTGGGGDAGLLRLDFPGYSGGDSLQEISWEEWFEKFDEQGLALLYQEQTAGGEPSNFNKIVSRATAAQSGGGSKGRGGRSRGGSRSNAG